jgi:GWxTD domain-containing protein
MNWLVALALAVAGSPLPASAAAQLSAPAAQQSGLVMRAIRFYRAEIDRTRVKGLVQIPLALLEPAGLDRRRSYNMSVRVADSTGLTLYQQSWQSHAADVPGSADAYTVEIVDFAVAPGGYRLDVSVRDSVSGRQQSSSLRVQALSDSSIASDLLLSPQMRLAVAEDTVPKPGEFRAGNSLVMAAAQVILTPLLPKVSYLLEVYGDKKLTGALSVAVKDSAGKVMTKTPEVPADVAAGGSVLQGQLDLTGLPPGNYRMVATLSLDGRTVERTAPFTMAALGAALARDTARRAVERIGDEGYFQQMPAEELDHAKDPLIYQAEPNELSVWSDELSTDAKRRFLTRFWQRRDPTPGTPRNEAREQFYGAINYANQAFREGGRNPVSGWRSDRGRIHIKNGAPHQVLRREQEGRAPRYEVWSYAKGKGSYYIFADRSSFGAFNLLHSSDIKEPGVPGWMEILGAAAVEDIGRFLGLDLMAQSRRF